MSRAGTTRRHSKPTTRRHSIVDPQDTQVKNPCHFASNAHRAQPRALDCAQPAAVSVPPAPSPPATKPPGSIASTGPTTANPSLNYGSTTAQPPRPHVPSSQARGLKAISRSVERSDTTGFRPRKFPDPVRDRSRPPATSYAPRLYHCSL